MTVLQQFLILSSITTSITIILHRIVCVHVQLCRSLKKINFPILQKSMLFEMPQSESECLCVYRKEIGAFATKN